MKIRNKKKQKKKRKKERKKMNKRQIQLLSFNYGKYFVVRG